MATKTDDATERFANLDETGKVSSRRWHRFSDCSMLGPEEVTTVTGREAELLGITECAVCAKRASGGPALDILEGFFGEDWPWGSSHAAETGPRDAARMLLDYLKDHNAFIAIRRPKDNGQVTN